MTHYRNVIILATVAFTLVAFIPFTQADFPATFELRKYFEPLRLPFPEQSANNLWTFHNKDHTEAFLPASGNHYYDYYVTGSIIGDLIQVGDPAWGGYGGVVSYPTFDGVAVHSGFICASAMTGKDYLQLLPPVFR